MQLSTSTWSPIGPAPVSTVQVSMGHSAGRIEVAAPDPNNADVMYLGANGGGVWKSGVWTNPSPTWLPVSDDQPSLNFSGYHPLVVHPADSKLVLGVVSGAGAGVLKSSNGGLGWTLLANNKFEGAMLGSIAVHPTNKSILYVSVWWGGALAVPGVYKSTDGGATWANTTAFHGGPVTDVIVAKFNPKHLYAGLARSNNAGASTAGVYRSTDEGVSWQLLDGLPFNIFIGDAIRLESATATGSVYASLFCLDMNADKTVKRYKTTDGGLNWKQLKPTPGTPELRSWHLLLAVDPRNGAHVFVNDAYTLFESTDSGQTWTKAETIGDDWVNMTFDAANKGVATADRNVYSYDLKSKTWTAKEGNALQVTQLYDVTLDQGNVDVSYGVAQDHVAAMKFSGSILWDFVPGGTGETGKVLIDPGNSSRLYMSNPLAPAFLVRRSTNGGASWTTIGTNNDFQAEDYELAYATQKSFVMDAMNPKRLLIGLTMVFECADATVANPTWKAISGVLSPSATVSGQYITALSVAPSDAKTIYAATSDGHMWRTSDSGANWKQNDGGLFGTGAGSVRDMRIDPAKPGRVFAVSSGGAGKNIWSLDASTNKWSAITGDMPKNLRMSSLAVDWPAPTVLIAGTARGVYRSTDSGLHWKAFGLFPKTVVTDLQTIPAKKVLAAATYGRGVWEILMRKKGTPSALIPGKPAPRLRRAPVRGSYFHVSELTMVPGRIPGEPLPPRRPRGIATNNHDD